MQKNAMSSFKIATCENFQGEKMVLYRRESRHNRASVTGGPIYDKDPPLTTSVW